MHHVGYAVDDVGAAVSELAGRGVEVIDSEPRRGLGGHLVSFVHPHSLHGVLAEMVGA
jgi:methylmalonyl-CoA/ethylmalonyl-CoA epimerase